MENILDLYALPYNPFEPVICTDEKSKQLLGSKRPAQLAKEHRLKRIDYEYKRNGTRNIFLAIEPKGGFRRTEIRLHRKATDFAYFIKELSELERYKNVRKIHLVLDNLNTHFAKSFYTTFSKTEAEQILSRIQFHYTPKHASWLDMAEIEIGIMDRQCIGGRIADEDALKRNITVWEKRRNRQHAKINWKFTTQEAREKFKYAQQD
jgi:hypothetical protein